MSSERLLRSILNFIINGDRIEKTNTSFRANLGKIAQEDILSTIQCKKFLRRWYGALHFYHSFGTIKKKKNKAGAVHRLSQKRRNRHEKE